MPNFKFLLILFIGFVDYLGIGLVYPIFAVMFFDVADPIFAPETSSAFRGAMLGILMGLTPLSAFVFAPLLGSFSDGYGRKKALLYGMGSGCVGYCLAVIAILCHSLWLLFVFRILVGITEASAAVAQAAIADISSEDNKARRFSLFSSSAGLGFTVGPFVGGTLAEIGTSIGFGYSLPFCIAGLSCLMNVILVRFLFPDGNMLRKTVSFKLGACLTSLRKVLLWKHLTWLFAACFCLSFAWAFFNEFMPVLLQSRFNFSLNAIGNYFAWGGIWYSVSSGLLTGPLLSRFSSERLIIIALVGCAACMSVFSMIENPQYIWLTLPVLMFFLATAFPTLASVVSNRTDNETQGEVLGVYYSIQGFAMGLSPMFVGSLIGAYPSLTGWGSAFMMVIACLIFLKARKKALVTF